METESTTKFSDRELAMPRTMVRKKTASEWIEDHASGTLRKARKLGFAWKDMYFDERVAHEWGWEFKMIPRSRLTFGDAYIEGDSPALTESCWHIERYLSLNPFPDSDAFEAKYVYVEGSPNVEGVGIVVRRTSAAWIPTGQIVYCIIAEYCKESKGWKHARNPS